jgi:molybdopterin converting factor small subunit
MRVRTHFYSYFRDLTGCADADLDVPPPGRVADLLASAHARFPRMAPMAKSTLVAVGVEYQGRDYVLQPGDEVSLFPPVQGG